jgi:hypothetical protein
LPLESDAVAEAGALAPGAGVDVVVVVGGTDDIVSDAGCLAISQMTSTTMITTITPMIVFPVVVIEKEMLM